MKYSEFEIINERKINRVTGTVRLESKVINLDLR